MTELSAPDLLLTLAAASLLRFFSFFSMSLSNMDESGFVSDVMLISLNVGGLNEDDDEDDIG